MRRKPATNLIGLLRQNYPLVYRISVALCGDPLTARKISWRVVRRAGAMYQTWETDEDATRWFARFTLLNSRGCAAAKPKHDALLGATNETQMIAVVYAVRQLPMQQREAFLLHHGLGMELRQLATAMDCSSAAASNHLMAATKALRLLAPNELGEFTFGFADLLERLTPPPGDFEVEIRNVIRKRRLSAVVRYAVLWPAGLMLLAVIAWEAYRFWKMIVI